MEEVEIRLTQGQKQGRKDVIKAPLISQQAALNSLVEFMTRKFKFLFWTDDFDYVEGRISTHVLTQLKNVGKALENIDSEDFGICETCHEPIPFERLMAMPTAAHCVQCAADNDRQHRIVSKRTFGSLIVSF